MKRSELKRTVPLQTHTGLRRAKPLSKKRSKRARDREFSPEIRRIVYERSNGLCERCHQQRIAHLHHAVLRRHVTHSTLEIALGMCVGCHIEAHAKREVREECVELAQELVGR